MRRSLGTLWLLACCLMGCHVSGTETESVALDGCRSSADCPKDLTCVARTCTADTAPIWPIRLELIPKRSSPSARAEIRDVRFESSPLLKLRDISLPGYSEFSGIAQLGNGQNLAVDATARAQSSSERPATYRSESIEDVTGARFIMSLPVTTPTITGSLQAVVYQLTVQPKERDRFPPWRVDPFQPPDEGGRVFFELPSPEAMISLSGQVLFSDQSPTPVPGLTVFATDEAGQTVSSTNRTDANGRFTIFFWPESEGQVVTVKVRRTTESGPLPDLRKNLMLAPLGEPNEDISLTIGAVPPIERFSGAVLGTEPIGGATLKFLSKVGDGLYRVDVIATDPDGQFEVALYPGSSYEVDVIPPLSSRYRVSRVPLEVVSGQAIELRPQRRVLVTGSIVDIDGEGINGARIYAELKTPFFADPNLNRPNEAVVPRGQYVQTGQNGAFVLQLDPGQHELTVTPPLSSGLAANVTQLNVPALDTTITGLEIELPPAAALKFRIIDATDSNIEGVRVRAFRTDTTPARWLGQAWSNGLGEVLLRVPMTE